MTQLLQFTVGGLRIGLIYGLVTLGLVVVYKSSKLINFAHGGLVMVGAYLGALFGGAFDVPFVVSLLVGGAGTAAFGALTERVVFRTVRGMDEFSAVIGTVAYGVLLMAAARVRYGSAILRLDGPGSDDPVAVGPVVVTSETLWLVGLSVLIGLATVAFFRYSHLGTVLRAAADNPTGAQLCGYRLSGLHTASWAVAGLLAGFGGVIVAPILGVTPDLMLLVVPAFVVAVVGGFDSLVGALVAGPAIGLAETYAAGYLTTGGKEAIGLLLLLAVLVVRPQGLFAEREVSKV